MQLKHLWQNLVCNTDKSWDRVRQIVINRDHHVCRYCGKFDANGEVDHILPLKKGGMDAVYNLAWACQRCNRSKGDKTIFEWVSYLIEHERKDILEQIADFLKCYESQYEEGYVDSIRQRPKMRNYETLTDYLSDSNAWLAGRDDWARMTEIISYLLFYARQMQKIPLEVIVAFEYFEGLVMGLQVTLGVGPIGEKAASWSPSQGFQDSINKIRKEIEDLFYRSGGSEEQPFVDLIKESERDAAVEKSGELGLPSDLQEAIFDIVETAIEADGFDGTQLSLFPRNGKNRDGTS